MIVLTLFIFAKGFVKAFAITCGIGIVVSLLSCLVFTRMFNSLVLPLVKDKEKFLGFEKLGQKVKAEV
jgi:preprotein translocase subunit SecD